MSAVPHPVARALDAALEATIAGSFTNIGYAARSRLYGWADPPRLDGRTAIVTGGNSGLGQAAATRLASLGAHVTIVARSPDRTAHARAEIAANAGHDRVDHDLVDLADFEAVRDFADRYIERHDRLDVLLHNAGALLHDRATNADGIEVTVASQVLAPFLLTRRLMPLLCEHGAAGPSRVIVMSSGGMYSERLDLDRLEMGPDDYDGVTAYARAKRAQVALVHAFADRLDPAEVVVHAAHPGWADTPGVTASLPRFRRVVGPFLRSVDQGADTVVWLASDPQPASPGATGAFWHDRRARNEHYLPRTRRADEDEEIERLWHWCAERTGEPAEMKES